MDLCPHAEAGDRDGHHARDRRQRDGLRADRCRQGPRARCALAVGILRRDAGAAGPVQVQIKRQSVRDIRLNRDAASVRHGPPDPAARPDRQPRPCRDLGPLDPPVRPARQRQVLDLATASAPPLATRSMSPAPSNIPARSSRSTIPSCTPPPKWPWTTRTPAPYLEQVRQPLCLLRASLGHHRR